MNKHFMIEVFVYTSLQWFSMDKQFTCVKIWFTTMSESFSRLKKQPAHLYECVRL